MAIKYKHPYLHLDQSDLWGETERRRFDSVREDASPNYFFSRELEQIRAGIMEVEYTELKGLTLVPPDVTPLDPGALEFTNRASDKQGTAKRASDQVRRGPRVTVSAQESSIKYARFLAAYGFTQDEVRAAAFANRPLPQQEANAARWALAVKLDNAILLGSAGPDDLQTTSFVGLFTASNTTTYAPTTGTAGTAFSGKNPDQIVNDLIGMENAIIQGTQEVEVPDTLVLPLNVRAQMQSRMGDGSDVTIIKHYLSNTDNIKTVVYSPKLNSNAAWTGQRAVMYRRDPMKLAHLTSIEFNQLPPQYEGWDTIIECEMKTAGLFVYKPKSICYADGV